MFIPEPLGTLFLGDYNEKQQLGFTKYGSLQCSEARGKDSAPHREQVSSAKGQEVSSAIDPFEWHFSHSDKVSWLGRAVRLSRWALLST